MTFLGINALWWALLLAVLIIAGLVVLVLWALGEVRSRFPGGYTASPKQRRAWEQERADINPALRRRS